MPVCVKQKDMFRQLINSLKARLKIRAPSELHMLGHRLNAKP